MNEPVWIDRNSHHAISDVLRGLNVKSEEEQIVAVEPAGDGNMNVTLRVFLKDSVGTQRSIVVKQSRPYVAKYEAIPAPVNRIHYEAEFYRFASDTPELANKMPGLVAWLPEQHLLVLEDLGTASDATAIYSANVDQNGDLPEWLADLFAWLTTLHGCSTGIDGPTLFANCELRKLNHQHIFDLPFSDPPVIDLDAICPGLNEASKTSRSDFGLQNKCRQLGETYLGESGTCLLHGDFYPGSWLLMEQGPFVIDPEFCFVGPAEFDWGVALAHLWMSGYDPAKPWLDKFVRHEQVSMQLVQEFAAVEVLRRIMGVAQLPLTVNLAQRIQLIDHAVSQLV